MITIPISYGNASQRQILQISDYIKDGKLVILPTDTLYAICCNALDSKAIDKLCKIKQINPEKTNLSIICCDISQAAEYARIDNSAFKVIRNNAPGPFTFLLKTASTLPKAFKGRKTVGVRIPDNDLIREVVKACEAPLLCTSVEFDDDDYAVSPSLIAENYEGRVDVIIEGTDGGTVPSTIVDLREHTPEILREGKGELI
ncbi:MAG: L-threonylcarbamoyladenylate synthase [Prevotella sp.]|nr:L-threonylcarbamoyladenylate synthase [Bacteroides sp.]MCM1365622.1 L-threonylcarbamoyladenylate synthase [Prevotella sp.]